MVRSIPVPRLADRFAKDTQGPGNYGEPSTGAVFPAGNKENTGGETMSLETMAATALLDLAPGTRSLP
jgi:hypothetical protein